MLIRGHRSDRRNTDHRACGTPSSSSPCPSRWPASCVSEPVASSPALASTSPSPGNPFDWVTGISWPGLHPDDISAADRAHPLASLGGPAAFPPAVWDAFARPGAEQRIRRVLTLPGQPSLLHAAREIGVKRATLDSQIRQFENTTGTTLLRVGPDGTISLTADGQQFAHDVRPVLTMLALAGTGHGNHRTLP